MSRRNLALRVLDAIFDRPVHRAIDAASPRRFGREVHFGRGNTETLIAAPAVRSRARYFYGSDAHARAGVEALVTYSWGAGGVPAHLSADAFAEWGISCDADGVLTFDGLFGAAIREMIVSGECLIVFLVDEDGLTLRLIPADQLDASLSRDLGNGARIDAGIETDANGRRVAFHIMPTLPTTQFESYAPPVRVLAEDVVHLFRPTFVGQTRGLSWLTPILLKLADLGLLSDALLKGAQVSAMHAGFLVDQNAIGGIPFEGEARSPDELDVSLSPGVVRRLPAGYDIKFTAPNQATQSIEFMNAQINEIAAGLGVPSFMLSHDVSRANYSSLRAALLTFKASIEAWQYSTLVPALNAIWKRWALVETLRGGADDSKLPTWRFQAMPSADDLKDAQADIALIEAGITSRKAVIEARGEDPAKVQADIAAEREEQPQPESELDDDESREWDAFDRSASFEPQTFENNSVVVIASTGEAVKRRDSHGEFWEALSLNPKHIDLARFKGASVLDQHIQGGARSVLGRISDAWIEQGQLRARIKFSARSEVAPIVEDIRAGVLKFFSIGYAVEKWAVSTNPQGERVKTAVRWRPHEISVVAVPADSGAVAL